ncbi:MAG: hypothetical protein MSA49_06600 [Clostridia bacterium]|nr:hypothetical protein [Clostridia bacterium]
MAQEEAQHSAMFLLKKEKIKPQESKNTKKQEKAEHSFGSQQVHVRSLQKIHKKHCQSP